MDDQLPEPLVPPDVDLRGYGFMPFFGGHLFSSEFNGRSSDEEWRAGVTLWWAAWNQVPAASLPDDDLQLARLADYGRDVNAWKAVREKALHGFVKCSDGRLYHRFLAQHAIEAYERRRKEKERKDRWKAGRSTDASGTSKECQEDSSKDDNERPCDVPGTSPERPCDVPGTRDSDSDSDSELKKTKSKDSPPPPASGGRAMKPSASPIALPEWLPPQDWADYVAMRKAKRAPLTPGAEKRTIAELEKLKAQGHDPLACLNQSIQRSYTGIFVVDQARGGGPDGRGRAGGRDRLPSPDRQTTPAVKPPAVEYI